MNVKDFDRGDGIVQVALSGSLDVHGMHAIDVPFHGYTAARRRPTIVDLSGVDYINSLGIGMLIAVGLSLKRHGAPMVLVCSLGPIMLMIETAGLQRFFAIVGTVADAESYLAEELACAPRRDGA